MKLRIDNDNEFVTRIKDNTSYEVLKERDLPNDTGKKKKLKKDFF